MVQHHYFYQAKIPLFFVRPKYHHFHQVKIPPFSPGQNTTIFTRSKYMGVWGRLRFARKPICVIGESHESRFQLPHSNITAVQKKILSKTNIFKLICYLLTNQRLLVHRGYFDLSTFTILKRAYPTCAVNCAICQPPDRVSNVKRGAADILQNTLFCWENCICPF